MSKLLTLGVLQQGTKLNLRANSDTIYANSEKMVTADEERQSIEAWFDYMNEEFDKLYEIHT